MKHREPRPLLWLALGVALVVVSQFRFGVGTLAWVAPVAWLRYLRSTQGWRSRLLFIGAMWLAWSAAVLKIVTGPIPSVMAIGFGLPISAVFAAAMLAHDVIRRRIDADLATFGFAALMVVAEWSLHGLMSFGTWGSAANTQLDQLALLQLASVTGLHGVSFLMYLVAGVTERALAGERAPLRRWAWGLTLMMLVVVSAGQARLASSSGRGVPTVTVAAVGTDSRVGTEPVLPGEAMRAEVERGLVRRTTRAARAGAELVVWNEGAIMVTPDDEAAFRQRMSDLAGDLHVDLVAAYVVPRQTEPLHYENKYVYLRADGSEDHAYLKHHPVPGEPAVVGTGPMPTVERDGMRIGGSICYDYDFPRQALANVGADLVVLPSSDWRGIDPLHTEMARMRAIESGHGILRSTRFGLSAGIDAQGRMRGFASHYDSQERILVVDMPKAGVATVYGRLGDWFPLLCGIFVLGLGLHTGRRVLALRRDDGLIGSEPSGACRV